MVEHLQEGRLTVYMDLCKDGQGRGSLWNISQVISGTLLIHTMSWMMPSTISQGCTRSSSTGRSQWRRTW